MDRLTANPPTLDAAARDELARKAEAVKSCGCTREFDVSECVHDMAFIDACSPDVILSLLAAVERGSEDTALVEWCVANASIVPHQWGRNHRHDPLWIFGDRPEPSPIPGTWRDAVAARSVTRSDGCTEDCEPINEAGECTHAGPIPKETVYRVELQAVAEECGHPELWQSAAEVVRGKLMHYEELLAERDSTHVALLVARDAVRDLNYAVSNLELRHRSQKQSTAIREGFERVIAAIDAAHSATTDDPRSNGTTTTPEPPAPTPSATWYCNKCGKVGDAATRARAEKQHAILSPTCDYSPAWVQTPVPPASAPAATPLMDSLRDCDEKAKDLPRWATDINAAHAAQYNRPAAIAGTDPSLVHGFWRKMDTLTRPAAPTGEEADDTMRVTDAALAHAEYTVQDEAEAAAIRQACARLTTHATALAALRARETELTALLVESLERRAREWREQQCAPPLASPDWRLGVEVVEYLVRSLRDEFGLDEAESDDAAHDFEGNPIIADTSCPDCGAPESVTCDHRAALAPRQPTGSQP